MLVARGNAGGQRSLQRIEEVSLKVHVHGHQARGLRVLALAVVLHNGRVPLSEEVRHLEHIGREREDEVREGPGHHLQLPLLQPLGVGAQKPDSQQELLDFVSGARGVGGRALLDFVSAFPDVRMDRLITELPEVFHELVVVVVLTIDFGPLEPVPANVLEESAVCEGGGAAESQGDSALELLLEGRG